MEKDGDLTLLGGGASGVPGSPGEAVLETFPNPHPGREYWVSLDCPEFTSVCPRTGQPDFGSFRIRYVPGKKCVETKSLKLYLHSFRNEGVFCEDAVNRVLKDLVEACAPEKMEIEARFKPRGGISITVEAKHP